MISDRWAHEPKIDGFYNPYTEGMSELEELRYCVRGYFRLRDQYQHDRDRILARFSKIRAMVYAGAEDLERWNRGEIDLLLAHPAATAFGLNMQQGGHTVVWFGTGWNLELYQQANARLHRQGQRQPVRVFNLIADDTVDERMAAAIKSKAGSQGALLKRLAATVMNETEKRKVIIPIASVRCVCGTRTASDTSTTTP